MFVKLLLKLADVLLPYVLDEIVKKAMRNDVFSAHRAVHARRDVLAIHEELKRVANVKKGAK